jgi:hypothetical protein
MRDMLDQALLNQIHQCRSNGAATRTERLAKFRLNEPLTGNQVASQDTFSDCIGDRLT